MHSGRRSTLTGSFEANMFFSDEPGYYENGNFGIRLETILRVVAMNLTETTYGMFLFREESFIRAPYLDPFKVPIAPIIRHPLRK